MTTISFHRFTAQGTDSGQPSDGTTRSSSSSHDVINGNTYRLCLLDTNALSEMVKNPNREFRNFIERLFNQDNLPCFSVFSILELRQRRDVYLSFLDFFSVFPCLFLKGHDQLLQDEISLYPNPSSLDPTLLSPLEIRLPPGMNRRTALETVLDSAQIRVDGQRWLNGRDGILDDMLSHVPDFQPARGKYSDAEIRFFLEVVVFQYVASRDRTFVEKHLARGVTIDAFPSVKIIAYTVFHKFYPDKTRKPSRSDVFDIIIAALLPYVDTVITERHQAEVIRKVKAQDSFLHGLDVRTLRDLRR